MVERPPTSGTPEGRLRPQPGQENVGQPAGDARQWDLADALAANFVMVAVDISALAAGFAQQHRAAVEGRIAAGVP